MRGQRRDGKLLTGELARRREAQCVLFLWRQVVGDLQIEVNKRLVGRHVDRCLRSCHTGRKLIERERHRLRIISTADEFRSYRGSRARKYRGRILQRHL